MVYVILGMHKSGTTLVAKLLHKSGINMGYFDDNVSYDQGNQFERHETLVLNNKILEGGWEPSLDITIPDSLKWKHEYKVEAQNLLEGLNAKYNNWGFKDPRTCLTYELWREILPEHKLIIVYRHPYEVLKHYKSAFSRFRYKTLLVWTRYNRKIVSIMSKKEKENLIVINYESLMKDDRVLDQLGSFTGKQIVDLRDKSMYRNRTTSKGLSFFDKIFLLLCRIPTDSVLKSLQRNK